MSADLSSLFTWNTKQVFVYVSASWPNGTSSELSNEAVIWDAIVTNPSADHLVNLGPAAMKKLVRSAKGKSVDPKRYALRGAMLPLPPRAAGFMEFCGWFGRAMFCGNACGYDTMIGFDQC